MKQINKIGVFAISVLTANLLSSYLFDFIIKYKKHENPYVDSLIGMAIIAFVFYPSLTIMNKYLKKVAGEYVKQSKKTAKNSTQGFFLGLLIALMILYYFYIMKWYGIDLLKVIFS